MTWRGEPLEHAEFQHTLPLGIRVRTHIPGAVSEYEERQTASICAYTWEQWIELTPQQRAASVAHCRVKRMIDLAANDVETEWHKRQMGKR